MKFVAVVVHFFYINETGSNPAITENYVNTTKHYVQ